MNRDVTGMLSNPNADDNERYYTYVSDNGATKYRFDLEDVEGSARDISTLFTTRKIDLDTYVMLINMWLQATQD